jgi:hypothetical protein
MSTQTGTRYTKAQREQFARNDAAARKARFATMTREEAAADLVVSLHAEADGSYAFWAADGVSIDYLTGDAAADRWLAINR